MGTIKIKKNIEKEIFYLPCVKCGSENIEFDDCGYSSFNVAWGKCKDCKHEVQISPCGCDINTETIISVWNKENNPELLKEKYQDQINTLQKLIDELPLNKQEGIK